MCPTETNKAEELKLLNSLEVNSYYYLKHNQSTVCHCWQINVVKANKVYKTA